MVKPGGVWWAKWRRSKRGLEKYHASNLLQVNEIMFTQVGHTKTYKNTVQKEVKDRVLLGQTALVGTVMACYDMS